MEVVTSGAPSRIRVLPSTLADQIAAGEVVERPASVVKELAENAIDAGARRIDIEVEAGGRRLIRVVDDGGGMSAEEARLALQRHATSKIARAEDLWGLLTFGFRGEALPSIAAVSRLTVRTKQPATTAGFQLTVEAGREVDATEVGIADGTQVEVRDLFFNTPARLKFLKSEATESGNISEAVLRLGLAHPEVHFRLKVNGRVALDLPSHREMGERVRAALARRGAGALHEAAGEEGGHRVRAFLASPEEAATTPRSTFLFVGRRFVRDRSLLHALTLGYGELLEKGRYPMAALFVDVPGQELDVNVHPQKLEVRFSRAQEVYAAVRHVVGAAVARAPWLAPPVTRSFSPPLEPASLERGPQRDGRPSAETPLSSAPLPSPPAWRDRERPSFRAPAAYGAIARDQGDEPPALRDTVESSFFGTLTYLGQLHATYLLCESAGELILIDQHAGHERVLFERLRAGHRDRSVPRQRLLFPIPIELDDEAAAMTGPDTIATLASLGFDVEPFGPATLLARAIPELRKGVDPKPLLTDVLHRLAEVERGEATEGRSLAEASALQLLSTMACHGAVRAGDRLTREEALALLRQLDLTDMRSHCPHGRPVVVRIPLAEIERRFGRT